MFCLQEKDRFTQKQESFTVEKVPFKSDKNPFKPDTFYHKDKDIRRNNIPFSSEKDPLTIDSDSSDEGPEIKKPKTSYPGAGLNLNVYQIPSYTSPAGLSIYPTTPEALPKFVNNPLNLANPLAFATNNLQTANNLVKSLQTRYSLPSKLIITPILNPTKAVNESGEIIRYKKNGEIAKKRGPPKGYKRKPKDLSQSFTNGSLLQAQNMLLTNFLNAAKASASVMPIMPDLTPIVARPQIKLPPGVELVELQLDPCDWFPDEPYKMVFSRKKNPKWKSFPFRCEHCFKGYRVVSTLLQHASERHGCTPKDLVIPCPCCPHVSTRRKQHKKHLETHRGRRQRLFCQYCVPPLSQDEEDNDSAISKKYPFDEYPQFWFSCEESLRLHKKRKHPYAAMFNYNWYCTWGEHMPNS